MMVVLSRMLALVALATLSAVVLGEESTDVNAAQATRSDDFRYGGDPDKGAEMGKMCISCHGHQGRSVTSRYPSLAGMDETRIVEGMKALRAGEKGHLMASMTRGLSDEDIADLAAYYSSLDP